MVGSFGKIIFETSDKRILTLRDFKRNTSARWAEHELINAKPKSEFLGPNLDTIQFTIKLNASLGIKPTIEMNKWLDMCRSGTVEMLIIGSKSIGVDKWSVDSVGQAWDVIWKNGSIYSATMDITLKEYTTETWTARRMVLF